MSISKQLLEILVCPEDKTPVTLADPALISQINEKIASGSLKNRSGQPVTDKIEAGLIRADNKILYPVRDDIPIMLVDEGINI